MIEWRARVGASVSTLSSPELLLAEQLHKLTAKLISCEDHDSAAAVMLDGAIELHKADFGTLHLHDAAGSVLEIAGQRGFTNEFVDAVRILTPDDRCTCGRAFRQKCTVVVEDVERDAEFEPCRAIARRAGFRAAQSAPVMTSKGDLLAVVSTYFREPHKPSEIEMRVSDLFARQAGEILHRLQSEASLQQEAQRKDSLAKELSHRVKNVLTMVQAISRESMKGSKGLAEYSEVFEGRMRALSHAHEALAKSQWQGATVDQLLHEQLADFGADRASWSGPDVRLAPNVAYVLAIVLHELGVNARKHGALRSGAGRITIDWNDDPAGDTLDRKWRAASRRAHTSRIGPRAFSNPGADGVHIGLEPIRAVWPRLRTDTAA